MATKLIENMDEEVWNKFTGYCKMNNRFVGEQLTEILMEYLKKKGLL